MKGLRDRRTDIRLKGRADVFRVNAGTTRAQLLEHEFRALYREYSRKLYNFVLWTTRNRSAADDILQNVFMNVWRCREVPAEGVERQRWLYAVTRNACQDFFRKVGRFTHLRAQYNREYVPSANDPDAGFVWEHLADLPENDRCILYLHLKIGYTYKEIGQMLGMAENLVRVRAFRTLKRLKDSITKKESWTR